MAEAWAEEEDVDVDEEELVESQHERWLEPEAETGARVEAAGALDSVWLNEKAGMRGLDKERIRALVARLTEGTAFAAEQKRKDDETGLKIEAMHERLRRLSSADLRAAQATTERRIAQLEASRDLSRTWLVVDMDAFFASVEERDQPSLRLLPVAVGGMGMISTANYVARRYGVRSAMPGWIAVKLCPDLIFVPPDFDKYSRAAEATRAVFATFDEHYSAGSLDEASLDITAYCAAAGCSGAEAAAALRAAVTEATGLTCSCGVGPNRMVAKIASDVNKPDGQCVVAGTREAVFAFMHPLPLRKVPGIGRVAERMLAAAGCTLCGDVLPRAPQLAAAALGRAALEHVLCAALGLGATAHPPPPAPGEAGRRGMGVERTFGDCSEAGALEAKLREICETLAQHLAAEGLRGRTLTLKLKSCAFELRTRSAQLPGYVCATEQLLPTALRLLRAELPCCARLLGLRVSGFAQTAALPRGQTRLGFETQPAAAEEPAMRCARCGAPLAGEPEAALHEDWHVAREVQARVRAEDAAAARASPAAQPPTRKRRAERAEKAEATRSIASFFAKAP